MDQIPKNYKGLVDINDIIDDALSNAIARRNQAIHSQDTLSTLSDEEAVTVVGGVTPGVIDPGSVIRIIIGLILQST